MEDKKFYDADDVAAMLSVSRPTAYRIIRQLNDELKSKGFIVISGRIPVKFFEERFYA